MQNNVQDNVQDNVKPTKRHELFVLGHARSGTTILRSLLNSAEEVLLLGEAHLFESHWNVNFVTDFNGHHERTRNVTSKGTRLPSQFAGMLPEEILTRLARHYAWVGEKIAIGPMSGLGTRAAAQALDYYHAFHLDASYVLTFRAPLTSLKSLHRLFPGVAISALLQGWMLSFVEIGAASNILKHVSVLPLEWLAPDTWARLQQKLGIQGRADASWFTSASSQHLDEDATHALAAQLAAEMGWDSARAAQFLARLSEVYALFLDYLSPETLYYASSVAFEPQVANDLLCTVKNMAAQLQDPVTSTRTLPGSHCAWLQEGALRHDRRTLAMPAERAQRFAGIVGNSLFGGGALALLDEGSAVSLMTEGLDMAREGPWLTLQAHPDASGHRHLTVPVPIAPMAAATVRLKVRRGAGQGRYLMLQVGDVSGFYNCVVDCQQARVQAMEAHGPVKSLLAQVDQLANGTVRVALSGMLGDGRDSCLRLYLCDASGAIEFSGAALPLAISDLVLSHLREDCGLDEVL